MEQKNFKELLLTPKPVGGGNSAKNQWKEEAENNIEELKEVKSF